MLKRKPKVKIVGHAEDFINVIGRARLALVIAGQEKEAQELIARINDTPGQLGKLEILCEYVQAC